MQKTKENLPYSEPFRIIITINHHFYLLNIYSQRFQPQYFFPSFLSFLQTLKWLLTNIRTSKQRSSPQNPDECSKDNASSIVIKNRTSLFWVSLAQLEFPHCLQCINCKILTNHYSTLSFFKIHHVTSLGTRSKALSKSRNAKYKVNNFCLILPNKIFAEHFSCNCFKIKMVFVVLHPGMKAECIPPRSTCCYMNF